MVCAPLTFDFTSFFGNFVEQKGNANQECFSDPSSLHLICEDEGLFPSPYPSHPERCFGFCQGKPQNLARQRIRTIAIASDFRVDGAKSPEIPQKEGVLGSEIATRNRKSLATFGAPLNRNAALLSLVSEIAAISGVRDGHRNRKNRKNRCDFGALSLKMTKDAQNPWKTPR